MPLFSVIIPTYNSSATLAACISSIVEQTFADFEIVIVDGLSKDNTVEICKSFANPKIKIYSEKDKGIYDAMNKGIGLAQGDWLYFLGSDDKLYDNTVLATVAEGIKVSDPTMIYGDVKFVHSGKIHDGEFDILKLHKKGNICHQAIFYNKVVFEKLGKYNLRYIIAADWDLNIRCFRHPDFVIKYIPKVIAHYNESDGISSSASNNFEPLYEELPLNRDEIINDLKKSKQYKIGGMVLKPFRMVRELFN